jgi:hypothetical protein
MCVAYVIGSFMLWNEKLGPGWTLVQAVRYQPWVNFMTAQAIVHCLWVVALLACQLYQVANCFLKKLAWHIKSFNLDLFSQILWLGLTTNERLNWTRYSYFGGGSGSSHSHNPKIFNRGVVQNFIDFFELSFLKSNKVDWMKTWVPHYEDEERYSDREPFLRDNRDNYQYV